MKIPAMTLAAWSFLAALAPSLSQAATPPSNNPKEILRANKEATGGAAWNSLRTTHVTATLATGGLEGTAESWEETLTGRTSSRFALGPLKGAEGFDGKVSWQEDDAGEITDQEGKEAAEGRANQVYRQAFAYWYPERGEAAMEHAGVRGEGERSFDVLRITPKGGRPMEMWIDRATHLLDRLVEANGSQTTTTYFSDYRDVQGRKVPFRSRVTNGEEKYDQVVVLTAFEANVPIDEARLRRPSGGSNDSGIAGGKTSFTAPFQLINNHIYLDVSIDGKPAFPVLFDTGGLNVLVPDQVERLGLKAAGKLQGRGAGEGSEDLALTKVGEIRIGDVYLKDQSFFVLPLQGLDKVEGAPVHGLIGYEVFKRFVVRLDYAKRLATFTLPGAFQAEAGVAAVPFTFDERTPLVEGELDGIKGSFSLDTGSRATLTLNGPFAEKNGLRAKYGAHYEAMSGWGVGGGVRSVLARAGSFRIGAVEASSPVIDIALSKRGAFAKPYLAGNIGGGLLKRFTVTLDYSRKRLYLVPNESYSRPEGWDRSGLWLNRAEGGFRVEQVEPATPGAEAGLAAGDLLLAIDGRAASDLSLSDLRLRLRAEPPGTRLALTVRKEDGSTKDLSLVLRELL